MGDMVTLLSPAKGVSEAEYQKKLAEWQKRLTAGFEKFDTLLAQMPELAALMERYPDHALGTRSEPVLPLVVDRKRAGFSAWYELFPRSCAAEPGRHGGEVGQPASYPDGDGGQCGGGDQDQDRDGG